MAIRASKSAAITVGSVLVALCIALRVSNVDAQRGAVQDPRGRVANEQDSSVGVYLPSDRSLSRAMARARERLAAREYHQSLGFLHEIFQRDEDAFLDPIEAEPDQRGLKAAAHQLIRSLPAEGLDAYELLHGSTARKQLDAALTSGGSGSHRHRRARVFSYFGRI